MPARRHSVPDPRRRRALVVLVACLSGAGLALIALIALVVGGGDDDGGSDEAEPVTTTLPEGDPVAADRIEVGTCFNDQDAVDLSTLPVVPCTEGHDNEVYHLFSLPGEGGARYPGNSAVADQTRTGCLDAFEAYVGAPYTESRYAIFPIPPSQASWRGGDREVVCALYDGRQEELTGSARGAAR